MTDRDALALSPERIKLGIEEMKTQYGPPPWAATLVRNDRFVVTVICQAPGHPNDWHYHLSDHLWTGVARVSQSRSASLARLRRAELLEAVIVKFDHVDVVRSDHRQCAEIPELPVAGPMGTPAREESAVTD